MSDLSLYAGLWDAIQRWSSLIDDVLVAIELQTDVLASDSLAQLTTMVYRLSINDIDDIDFADLRVANIIALELGKKMNWQQLSTYLSQHNFTDAKPILESIIQCLSLEHISTAAKMRRRRS